MPYLIDTDWLIDYMKGVADAETLLDPLFNDGVAMSAVTYMELLEGAAEGSSAARGLRDIETLSEQVPVLPFTGTTAAVCANMRAQLRRAGARVNQRAMDLMIAATAVERGMTLITRNRRDDADIAGLSILPEG